MAWKVRDSALIEQKQIADVCLPTRWANFRVLAFEGMQADSETKEEHIETALALVLGDIHCAPPIVRIHSQCATGDVFHSLRCDCHDQLQLALRLIAGEGSGILLYEHQEGRGIGLMEKLRAYELQDQGLDTIEANLMLGHGVDLRNYALSVEVLRFLNIRSLQLMTNNPDKVEALESVGIRVVERISAEVEPLDTFERYVQVKQEKMGHIAGRAAPESPLPL